MRMSNLWGGTCPMNMDAKKRRQRRISQLNPPQQSWQEWREPPSRNRFLYKCFLSLCIYALIWTIFHLDEHSYAQKAQQMIKVAMNDSFDYESLTKWYKAHIGAIPTLLPIFDERLDSRSETDYSPPVAGHPVSSNTSQPGVIELHTTGDQAVTSIGRGLVQYVAPSRTNEMTVKVLHSNGVLAVYGGLDSVEVEKNDWLEVGALIGHTDILYFALKKGEQYVNPGDVIPFD
jgi:stage IV sporulation protein FA